MTRHCLYFCLLLFTSLTSAASAQDTTRFVPDTLRLGNIPFGTIRQDSATLHLTGQARTVNFRSSDTALNVTSSNPYQFLKGPLTLEVRLQVIPRKLGNDTLFLIASDTLFTDTLVILLNVLRQTDFRFSEDTLKIGAVLLGASVTDSFFIISTTNQIRLTGLFIPDSSQDSLTFTNLQLPVTIAEGDSALVLFSIAPTATGLRAIHLSFVDTSGVTRALVLTIEGILQTSTDTVFALSKGNTMARASQEDVFTMTFRLRNDSPREIVINDFTIDDTVHFAIEDFPLLPLILDPGAATPPIEVYSKATGSGFFRTNIRVPNDGGLASEYTLGVQVLKTIQASVPPIKTTSGIVVYQSPTEIAIEGLPFESGTFEIFDLLGRKIVEHPIISREIFISKIDASGSRIENGCYIIRLTDAKSRHSEMIKVLLVSY